MGKFGKSKLIARANYSSNVALFVLLTTLYQTHIRYPFLVKHFEVLNDKRQLHYEPHMSENGFLMVILKRLVIRASFL